MRSRYILRLSCIRLQPIEESAQQENQEAEQRLKQLQEQLPEAEQSVHNAKQTVDLQNAEKADLEAKLLELQHKYYLAPDKVREEEVIKEVTVEVEKEITFD